MTNLCAPSVCSLLWTLTWIGMLDSRCCFSLHTSMTQGQMLGTPAYMAPEQVETQKHSIGPATDVWALGVMQGILRWRVSRGYASHEHWNILKR